MQSFISVYVDFGLQVVQLLTDQNIVPETEFRWPTVPEMKEPSRLLVDNRENVALLKGILAVIDSGRFCCGKYVDASLQNAYYECYTQAEEVMNLLVYNFKGSQFMRH